jgi:lysophospholipase L1-like esterase
MFKLLNEYGIEQPNWPFITHYLPERTAYMLCAHEDQIEKVLLDLEDSEIIFVFGEIDCRAQILRHCKEDTSTIDTIVDHIVDKYTNYVKELRQTHGKLKVMTVVPTGDEENIYFLCHYPNKKERELITLHFNESLRLYCEDRKIPLLDAYYLFIDENGERKTELIRDDCHLNYKAGELIWKIFF